MPIRFPKPPQPVVDRLDRPGAAAAAEETALPAQPVFTVALDELLEAARGAAAEESVSAPPTWRYSRFGAEGQAEVLELPAHGGAGGVAVGDDRFSPMIREALAIASEDPRVREHEYEARLYRVPALSLLALWLHAAQAFDLFVPIGRQVGELEPNRVFDDGDFTSRLRTAAERIGALYDEADDADELGS